MLTTLTRNLSALGLLALLSATAHAQIFAPNAGGSNVGEYDATSGAAINTSFLSGSGVNVPLGIVTYGNEILVSNIGSNAAGSGFVSAYSTSGTLLNASLITGLSTPEDMIVQGNSLYVTNGGANEVSQYALSNGGATATLTKANFIATGSKTDPIAVAFTGSNFLVAQGNKIGEFDSTGAVINASFISAGLNEPSAILVYNNNIFVANTNDFMVAEYTLSGSLVNSDFISMNQPDGIAESNGNFFISSAGLNGVSEYNADTGALVNANFITGLNVPSEIAIEPGAVPEPSTWMLLVAGLGALAYLRRRTAMLH
jgi:hypothetical protein